MADDEGKVVLITGCGSGIGLATALAAARAGHCVYGGLRSWSSAPALEAAVAGLPITPLALDVTRADERAAAVRRIVAEQGRLDVLVNNAGVALGGFLEQIDQDELRWVFEVNTFGPWAMTRDALPALRASRAGIVVFVSSTAGRSALPGMGAYAASKFALEAIGEAFRHELGLFGIRVALVEPGAFRTDIFGRNRRLSRHARDPHSPYAPFAERVDRLAVRVADRLAGDPADVARTIVALFDRRRPRLRHPVGADAHLRAWLLRFAPFGLWEILVRGLLRPPRRQSSTVRYV